MKSPGLEEENIIEDMGNLFRLNKPKKVKYHLGIEGIKNIFRLEKENNAIKDRIISDIWNRIEHEEGD